MYFYTATKNNGDSYDYELKAQTERAAIEELNKAWDGLHTKDQENYVFYLFECDSENSRIYFDEKKIKALDIEELDALLEELEKVKENPIYAISRISQV